MDRLKSIFISGYVAFVLIGIIYTVFQIFQRTSIESGFCNLIILCTVCFYFGLIYLTQVPRTSKNMTVLSFSILIGFIGNIYFNAQSLHIPSLSIGIVGFIGWILYTYWATDFSGRKESNIKVGSSMPEVSFKTPEGETVAITRYMNAPNVILFYRGNWCPFCMAQIKELAKEYRKIKEQGANLIFISPQSPKHTKHLAKQFDIPAIFLIDEDLKAAKTLGIFNAYGTPLGMEVLGFETDNVYPTLIITDKKGIVRFADLTDNYRMRPEPGNYLEILEGI